MSYAIIDRAKAADKPVLFQVTAPSGTSPYLQLDNKEINGKPKAHLIITQLWTSVYNAHPVGVYYDAETKSWYIVNEDYTDIPAGAQFNVRALSATSAQSFRAEATVANSEDDFTLISSTAVNKKPSSLLLLTHFMNPTLALADGVGLGYLGVYYFGPNWAVYNENVSAPATAEYNLVNITGAAGASVQSATGSNVDFDYFPINDATANNNPNAVVFVTHNYNPGGVGNNYVDHPVGVFYLSGQWQIFYEDEATPNPGDSFNVQVYAGVTP